MSKYYLLNDDKTCSRTDMMTWARNFETEDRRVALNYHNGVKVSTVFLGMDHQWGNGPPLLFETMVFGGEHDGMMDRYTTWDEAVEGHLRICGVVLSGVNTGDNNGSEA